MGSCLSGAPPIMNVTQDPSPWHQQASTLLRSWEQPTERRGGGLHLYPGCGSWDKGLSWWGRAERPPLMRGCGLHLRVKEKAGCWGDKGGAFWEDTSEPRSGTRRPLSRSAAQLAKGLCVECQWSSNGQQDCIPALSWAPMMPQHLYLMRLIRPILQRKRLRHKKVKELCKGHQLRVESGCVCLRGAFSPP